MWLCVDFIDVINAYKHTEVERVENKRLKLTIVMLINYVHIGTLKIKRLSHCRHVLRGKLVRGKVTILSTCSLVYLTALTSVHLIA